MAQKTYILDIPIHNITIEQGIQMIFSFLKKGGFHDVYTPNPEIIMAAQKDRELKQILSKASLVVPDGIGVVLASYLQKEKLRERVAGYDLVQGVFQQLAGTEHTVYFLGGAPGVAEQASEKMKQTYKGLRIIGVHDGYFTEEEESEILKEIKSLKPDLLLVGLGAPKQEKWISKHKRQLPVKVCIGVGGSFDGMSGRVKRAPMIFRKLGLEWFHRLITQPTRAKRMLQLPVFAWVVLWSAISRNKKQEGS